MSHRGFITNTPIEYSLVRGIDVCEQEITKGFIGLSDWVDNKWISLRGVALRVPPYIHVYWYPKDR